MYCSLSEAFQSSSVIPDFSQQSQSQQQKRRKKRTIRSMLEGFQNEGVSGSGNSGTNTQHRARLPPPEPLVIEPDRPAHRPLPEAELLGQQGPAEFTESSSYSAMLGAMDYDMDSYFPHPNEDVKSEDVYLLEPDWTKPFGGGEMPSWIKERMASKDAEVPLQAAPWMDGAPTLWQKVPARRGAPAPAPVPATVEPDRLDAFQQDINRKLEAMFSKLEAMDRGRSESAHIEIILFVLGGIFLLLLVDMLVKQGTQATMMLAATAGGGFLGRPVMSWR